MYLSKKKDFLDTEFIIEPHISEFLKVIITLQFVRVLKKSYCDLKKTTLSNKKWITYKSVLYLYQLVYLYSVILIWNTY